MARAVLDGIDPYQPLPELAAGYLGSLPRITLPHPTPHPPPVALISLPLGLLSYEASAIIWFLLEIVFIFISVYLLMSILGKKPNILYSLFLTLLMLAWRPVVANLGYGQLMTLLLVLLIGSWPQLR